MQNGPFIKDRIMPGMIRTICDKQGITYQSFSDDWVLRLEKNGQVRWIVGYKFDVNLSAAGWLAQDKVATYMALQAANIPAVEHYLVRSTPDDPGQWRVHLPELRGVSVVLKPLSGTGGRAVERYESAAEAVQAAQQSTEPAWAIAPYYDIQAEYRLIVLDGTVLLSLEKTQPAEHGELKLFNLGQGAVAVDIADKKLADRLQVLAIQTMQALSLRLAAIDIVRIATGELRVLEANDGIMLENYAAQSAEYKRRAAIVYSTAVTALFR